MLWSPPRCAKRDTNPFSVFPTKGKRSNSFFRRMVRTNRMPQIWSVAREKRSCENGIFSSAVHPRESIEVTAIHTGSQD